MRFIGPLLRDGFNFPINPNVELWDGSTFFGGNASNSSSQQTNVVGPGTLNPIGFSLIDLAKAYWRVRQANCDADYTLSYGGTTTDDGLELTGTATDERNLAARGYNPPGLNGGPPYWSIEIFGNFSGYWWNNVICGVLGGLYYPQIVVNGVLNSFAAAGSISVSGLTVFGNSAPLYYGKYTFGFPPGDYENPITVTSASIAITGSQYWEYRDASGNNPLYDADSGDYIG